MEQSVVWLCLVIFPEWNCILKDLISQALVSSAILRRRCPKLGGVRSAAPRGLSALQLVPGPVGLPLCGGPIPEELRGYALLPIVGLFLRGNSSEVRCAITDSPKRRLGSMFYPVMDLALSACAPPSPRCPQEADRGQSRSRHPGLRPRSRASRPPRAAGSVRGATTPRRAGRAAARLSASPVPPGQPLQAPR